MKKYNKEKCSKYFESFDVGSGEELLYGTDSILDALEKAKELQKQGLKKVYIDGCGTDDRGEPLENIPVWYDGEWEQFNVDDLINLKYKKDIQSELYLSLEEKGLNTLMEDLIDYKKFDHISKLWTALEEEVFNKMSDSKYERISIKVREFLKKME